MQPFAVETKYPSLQYRVEAGVLTCPGKPSLRLSDVTISASGANVRMQGARRTEYLFFDGDKAAADCAKRLQVAARPAWRESASCMHRGCSAKLKMFSRHHCRKCGGRYCSDHVAKASVPEFAYAKKQWKCHGCSQQTSARTLHAPAEATRRPAAVDAVIGMATSASKLLFPPSASSTYRVTDSDLIVVRDKLSLDERVEAVGMLLKEVSCARGRLDVQPRAITHSPQGLLVRPAPPEPPVTCYTAPEALRGQWVRQSQMWSAGCTIFWLMTGRKPLPPTLYQPADIERVLLGGGVPLEIRGKDAEGAFRKCGFPNFERSFFDPDPRRRMTPEEACRAFQRRPR